MAREFESPIKKLIKDGYESSAQKIQNLINDLVKSGELPEFILRKKSTKAHTLPLELAQKLNQTCGSDLSDEIKLESLSGPSNLKQISMMNQEMPAPAPKDWTEFLKALDKKERGAINRIINNLSRNEFNIGNIREASIEELTKVRNIDINSAEFAKAMFAKKED